MITTAAVMPLAPHGLGAPSALSSTHTADELQPLAQAALRQSPLHALQRLRVDIDGDALAIRGTVGCYYHKQLAQETVRCVIGATELINAVRVDAPKAR